MNDGARRNEQKRNFQPPMNADGSIRDEIARLMFGGVLSVPLPGRRVCRKDGSGQS
jgi:hypothetical protein